ncbi:MAG: DUF1254 domain-containing protein [Pseudomonadota bacterium]
MIYAVAGLLGSIVLAGLVHILTILAVPHLADDTIWDDLQQELADTTALVLPRPTPNSSALGTVDPAMVMAACRFDLGAGPLLVSAPTNAPQWMLTVHAPGGGVIYGVTSETELLGGLEIEIRTEAQERGLIISDAPDQRVRIRSDWSEGFVLFRMLAAHPDERAGLERLAQRVRCRNLPDRL